MLRTTRLSALRNFSSSARAFLQAGDSIPSVSTLREGSPGNEVDLAELTKSGKSIIVGVPGAFSPACSASHVPGYINNLEKFESKGYKVFVTGVNDSFVFKAWAESLNAPESVRFIADPSGDFAKASDLAIDASKFFGGVRAKRFALIVDNGEVVKQLDEPDNFSVNVSSAENVLKEI
ncbi:unnamed protein product [Cyberlindnera jadinii]|uniref:Redoxin n=1 Tax=Cyberlindnera jadinii (strain ATCC 18201 / CBS 1600 / BCRC 20928 / JCM 3617 / NBRC 0987 / NRRL Y-1542) TaxID=983966 RepID=A0A0H5C0A9_CYBJN|nr:Redoxin [Cyberlindnera jadinii NRRL Y-1542]ODV76214.1 Redoxin [Cyberlindnera jadinii NRRL Y-1542]CEP20877.1 unnamed protein product [Cyberlindnera jadinii]